MWWCEKMFKNKIVEESVLDKIYQEIKQSEYPLFIWGAGSMSVEVERCLEEQDIPIEGLFINEDIESVHIIQHKLKIYSLGDIEKKYSKVNVVIGHGHFEKKEMLNGYGFIHKIYIIPNPYSQYRSRRIGRYVNEHRLEVEKIMNCLVDEVSREALRAYCLVNQTDDINYLLNRKICIDTMFGLEELHMSEYENYIDVGAWEGDTVELFMQKVSGQYTQITAIEPDPNSFMVLKSKMSGKRNISFLPYGVGKEEGELYLDRGNTQSAHFVKDKDEQEERMKIEVKTLDSLFANEKVSLIKISIPFLFLEVLQGCKECLRNSKPRLVVNVAADDGEKVFDTINWIQDLELGYNIALRFDFPMPTRLYLYAY